jgi:hypothetical protein
LINVYTDKKHIPKHFRLEMCNDLFFMFNTINEPLTEQDVKYIKLIDNANVLSEGRISTPMGTTTLHNLSTGCKTLLNIFHNPNILFNVVECGGNVLDILFTQDNISFYMPASQRIKTITSNGVCFNDSDIVSNLSQYGHWWEEEYERRCEVDDI